MSRADAATAGVSDSVMAVSVWQTILVYAGIPLVIYGLLAVLSMGRRAARPARYRPGQPWTYPPAWWMANPAGLGHDSPQSDGGRGEAAGTPVRTARGGARGSW